MIKHSKEESDTFGLKIGRISTRNIDKSLVQEIASENFDLVKLNVPSNNKSIFNQLDQLGFPYTVADIISEFRCKLNNQTIENSLKTEYELFNGKNEKELYDLVISSFSDNSGSFYSNALADMNENKKIEQQAKWVINNFNGKKKPRMRAWFMKYNGENIGFVANIENKDSAECILSGIIPKFRNKGLWNDFLLSFQKRYKNEGKRLFIGKSQIQNIASQKTMLRESFTLHNFHLSIHINCLLSKNIKPSETIHNINLSTNQSLFSYILEHYSSKNKNQIAKCQKVELSKTININENLITITYPNNSLTIYRVINSSSKSLCSLFYFFHE